MTDDVAEDPEPTSDPDPDAGGSRRRGRRRPDDDPFADLVLDESFVKAASVYEAPARTRAAVRRYPATDPAAPGDSRRTRRRVRRSKATAPAPSPRDWTPAEQAAPSRRRGRLLGVGAVLVVALVAGYLVVGNPFGHAARPATAAAAAASGKPAASPSTEATKLTELIERPFERGHCYIWDQTVASADVNEVTCDSPHLFEAATDKTVSVANEFHLGAAFPTDDQWTDIDRRYCLQTVEQFLGYPVDPHGRFFIGAIRPAEDSWQTGYRTLKCGLSGHTPGQSAPGSQLDLFTGKVEGADQSWVYPVGTCLFSAAGTGQDNQVVLCADPHQYVAIGNARLPDTPTGAPPSDAVFGQQAAQHCATVARGALGASFRESTTERLGWFVIRPESWQVGTREFTCTVNFTTTANQPRTVTGDQPHPTPGVLA